MYYIKIRHNYEDTCFSHETVEYFETPGARERYVKEFNRYLYDPDLCYITAQGNAEFNSVGHLITRD